MLQNLTEHGDYRHVSTGVGDVTRKSGVNRFLAIFGLRPATATIYNITTTDANWTAVTTGLTGVLGWRLSIRDGSDCYFAFEAAPTNYATAFGVVSMDTDISAIYVKRTGSANITAELLVWTI